MDNFRINVVCEGREALRLALQLVFNHKSTHWQFKAKYYVEHPVYGLVFLSNKEGKDSQRLPVALNADTATELAWQWLAETEYPQEPPHDGSNNKGFRVYCDYWGHVGGSGHTDEDGERLEDVDTSDCYHQAIVAVKPTWTWYGK